jgi:hypothetical protein
MTIMKRRSYFFLALLVLILAGGIVYWRLTSSPVRLPSDTPLASRPTQGSEANQTRKKVLGTWQDDYQGKRTMTLNEDGTGTMLVELTGAKAVLFADKLRFDMQWSLDGKKLIKKTISGEPQNKVNIIINTMGDTAEDTLVEVTEEKLLLLDKDGKTQYNWRRVKASP